MPENRDQGIGLNGSVKKRIVAVFSVRVMNVAQDGQLRRESVRKAGAPQAHV